MKREALQIFNVVMSNIILISFFYNVGSYNITSVFVLTIPILSDSINRNVRLVLIYPLGFSFHVNEYIKESQIYVSELQICLR